MKESTDKHAFWTLRVFKFAHQYQVAQSEHHAASTDACMENSQSDPPNVLAASEAQVEVEQKDPDTVAQPVTSERLHTESSQAPEGHPIETNPVESKDESPDRKSGSQSVSSPSEGQEVENKPPTPGQSAANTSAGQNYVPPVKRFKSVNINKNFLQKNQGTTSAGSSSSAGSTSKQAGAIGASS